MHRAVIDDQQYNSAEEWSSRAYVRELHVNCDAHVAYLRHGVELAAAAHDSVGESWLRTEICGRFLFFGRTREARMEFEDINICADDRSYVPLIYASVAADLSEFDRALRALDSGFPDVEGHDFSLADAEMFKIRRVRAVAIASSMSQEVFEAQLSRLNELVLTGGKPDMSLLRPIKARILQALQSGTSLSANPGLAERVAGL